MKWQRFEWLTAAALALLALLVRLPNFNQLGLTHFDEGGYAVGALALARGEGPDQFLSQQHFLSPPGYFGLGGMFMQVVGESATVLFLISLFFGALTAPLLFALVRESASRGSAAGAGVLLATSDFHVHYSRMALTDVSFTFLLLLALLLFTRGFRTDRMSTYLMAGIVVGFAWLTKYHGWLAGLVAILAHGPRLKERGVQLRLIASASMAIALYAPWYFHVESLPGGYAALTAEQGRFLSDWTNLVQHIWLQVDAQRFLESPLSGVGFALALMTKVCIDQRTDWKIALMFVPALLLFQMSLGSCIALFLMWVATGRNLRSIPRHVLVATVLFAVLTPLYHAYPRLALPFVCGFWMCVVPSMGRLTSFSPRTAVIATLLAAGAVVVAGPTSENAASSVRGPWASTDGLQRASRLLARQFKEAPRIYVFAEPAVVFHLRQGGVDAEHVNSAEELEALVREPSDAILVGGHYFRALGMQEEFGLSPASATFPWEPGDVRLLNDAEPWRARSWQRSGESRHRLEVFRLD